MVAMWTASIWRRTVLSAVNQDSARGNSRRLRCVDVWVLGREGGIVASDQHAGHVPEGPTDLIPPDIMKKQLKHQPSLRWDATRM